MRQNEQMDVPKVLIVDDSRMILAHLKKSIEALGNYEVIKASNGQEALEQLGNHPDTALIFLDLKMPIMTGLQFLGVRRIGPHARIPVVVISGEDQDALDNGVNLGAVEAIKKPVDKDIIRPLLERYVLADG